MQYDWDFRVLVNPVYVRVLIEGLLRTLELSATCIALGTPLGFLVGILPTATRGFTSEAISDEPQSRVKKLWWRLCQVTADLIVILFVDVIRAIPLLLFMLTCYYVLPYLIPNAASGSNFQEGALAASPFVSAAIAMAINLAAFVADLVRAAFAAVPRGSVLAGLAIGMSRATLIRRIILPEVVREIWPGLVLLDITMLKMSTLASSITVWEVLHSAESVIQITYRTLEFYLVVCAVFVAVVVPLSVVGRRLERSEALRRRT
jgi:polar amino acid transport system permease protein